MILLVPVPCFSTFEQLLKYLRRASCWAALCVLRYCTLKRRISMARPGDHPRPCDGGKTNYLQLRSASIYNLVAFRAEMTNNPDIHPCTLSTATATAPEPPLLGERYDDNRYTSTHRIENLEMHYFHVDARYLTHTRRRQIRKSFYQAPNLPLACSPILYLQRRKALLPVCHSHAYISPYLNIFHLTTPHLKSAAVRAWTTLVPSLNLVLKILFAFWNMPSLSETTMNCEPLNLVLIRRPIFCVCERSRAASTSSRMYIGAGLNWRSAMMRERAMRDLQPVSTRGACEEGMS